MDYIRENTGTPDLEEMKAARGFVRDHQPPYSGVDDPGILMHALEEIRAKYPWLDTIEISSPMTLHGVSLPSGNSIDVLLSLLKQKISFKKYESGFEALNSMYKGFIEDIDTMIRHASPKKPPSNDVPDYYKYN